MCAVEEGDSKRGAAEGRKREVKMRGETMEMDSLGESTKETRKGARHVQVSQQHLGDGGEP